MDILSIDDFVVPGEALASSEVLDLGAGLEQEAAIGDSHSFFLAVTEPDIEAAIVAFAVNGQEVQIIVDSGEDGVDVESPEVTAGRGQEVPGVCHPVVEGVFF